MAKACIDEPFRRVKKPGCIFVVVVVKMSKKAHKESIVAAMRSLGTYKPEYDLAIDSLADILDQRDRVFRRWKKSGGDLIVSGEKMDRTHPLLREWKDLNAQALSYMKELSLTHQSMKRMAEAGAKLDANDKKKLTLFDAISNISEEES